MSKLSPAMVNGLREIASPEQTREIQPRTLAALRARFLIKPVAGGWQVTKSGRHHLEQIDRDAKAKRDEAERLSRPVPAKAFVEPSASVPLVLDFEYEDEADEIPAAPVERTHGHEPVDASGMCVRFVERPDGRTVQCGEPVKAPIHEPAAYLAYEREMRSALDEWKSGPSVRLTTAPDDVRQEATDAEVLQLCAMLDHGASVHRALFQSYGVMDAGPFRLDLDAVNRAARDAVRFGLVRQALVGREYLLTVEPIHLLTGDEQVTRCGRYPGAVRLGGHRLRVTSDPTRVTHEGCES